MYIFRKFKPLIPIIYTVFLLSDSIIATAQSSSQNIELNRFEQECHTLKTQLNEDLKDDELHESIKAEIYRLLNREKWHTFIGEGWTIGMVTERFAKDIKGAKRLFDQHELGAQASSLILRLRKFLDCEENLANEDWTKYYIEAVEKLNKRQITHRDYVDAQQSLRSSIASLIALTQRLRTINDVYKQNLEGIPTNILVLGKATSTDRDRVKRITVYRNISTSAKSFLSINKSIKLLFSNTKLSSRGLLQNITHHKSGKVEDYGANPVLYTDFHTHYVLQKYRIFPVSLKNQIDSKNPTSQSDSLTASLNEAAKKKAEDSWHTIPEYFVISDINSGALPGDSNNLVYRKNIVYRKAGEMLEQIRSDNITSENRIRSSEQKFMSNRRDISSRKELELESLTEIVKKAMSMIQRLDDTTDFSKLESNLNRIMRSSDDDIEAMENTWGKSINLFFDNNRDLFETQVQNAKEKFEEVIKQRVMTIFTREDDIVSDDDSRIDVAIKLAEKGVRSLCERQKSLVSYQISVFKNGKLESQKANTYYDNGTIVRSIMVVPVVQNIPYSEGTKERVSLLLAHEIQFKQANKKIHKKSGSYDCEVAGRKSHLVTTEKPSNKARDDSNSTGRLFKMTDMEKGLEWVLMPLNDCRMKTEYERDLPAGFALPTIEQLSSLRVFMEHTKKKEVKIRLKPLLESGRYLWSQKARSVFKEEFLVYSLFTGKSVYDPVDACNFSVGVRIFG